MVSISGEEPGGREGGDTEEIGVNSDSGMIGPLGRMGWGGGGAGGCGGSASHFATSSRVTSDPCIPISVARVCCTLRANSCGISCASHSKDGSSLTVKTVKGE